MTAMMVGTIVITIVQMAALTAIVMAEAIVKNTNGSEDGSIIGDNEGGDVEIDVNIPTSLPFTTARTAA